GARGCHGAGVCVFLGGMPLVPVSVCADLILAAQSAGYAARPRCGGKPGHPVAFTRAAFADLIALIGDTGTNAANAISVAAGPANLNPDESGRCRPTAVRRLWL
ncbi:hypothetical protein FKK50_27415, partial [Klebsiella pneumoniae]|nr:hypothetical protein [Klebsiella pneumoniae]